MALMRRESRGLAPRQQRGGLDPLETIRDLLSFDPLAELARGVGVEDISRFVPSFEVKETKDALVISADMPGVQEADLEVDITGNRLTIRGRREQDAVDDSDRFYAVERAYGEFTRTFTLPPDVSPEGVTAEIRDGVFRLVLPKKAESSGKRIPVLGKGKGKEEKKEAKA